MARLTGVAAAANAARVQQQVNYRTRKMKATQDAALDELAQITIVGLKAILADAMLVAEGGALEAVSAAASSLSTALRNRARSMQAIHEKAGEAAVKATVAAYGRNRLESGRTDLAERFSRINVTDRKYRRFAGNQLARALNSSEMFVATADGILWGNKAYLDDKAPQWYRLNYGAGRVAGSAGSPIARAANLKIFGQIVATIRDDNQPSAAFTMPAGFFLEAISRTGGGSTNYSPVSLGAGRGNQFVPWGWSGGNDASLFTKDQQKILQAWNRGTSHAARATQGIKPQRFMDAGRAAMVQTLSFEYSELIQGWLKEAGLTRGYSSTSPIAKSGALNRRQASGVLKRL